MNISHPATAMKCAPAKGAVSALCRLMACLALILPLPAIGQEAMTPEEARQQLDEKRGELAAARERELELARELESLAREESELKGKLIGAAQRVQASEARLSAIEIRLNGLETDRAALRSSIDDRRESLAKLLASMQRIGHEPP
ncbi:MAG: hypothetical protein VX871_05500, partial [Pseudomonadota bacterium]|nr:hypothetical protein [Pseudomonadota bacterium]